MMVTYMVGCMGIISNLMAFLIPEGYKKKDIVIGILYSIIFIVIGGLLSGFKFSRFISQFFFTL